MITVVGNLKGGSGKSTVAFNLAVWLAAHGKRVSAFDLDPQRTLTDVHEVRSEEGYTPLFSLHYGGADLVDDLISKSGEVIVDVGTADMAAMKSALSVADRIVIPVPPSQADIWSTQRFLTLISRVVSEKSPEVCVFVNRADTHHSVRESDEAEEALADLQGVTLIKNRLHQRTAYRRSFSEGVGVFEAEPSSKASLEFRVFAGILYPETRDKGGR
ncbi:MAG: AAA family ATPase [Gammaproteobacteria bacterium]|nr:AAA family ATPase [Gammaproteobacteria bacterium]